MQGVIRVPYSYDITPSGLCHISILARGASGSLATSGGIPRLGATSNHINRQ